MNLRRFIAPVPGAIFVFFCVVLWNASVMEDAYITFRVVDNFVNGYGLRWNLDERVQVYTHPLWMFLHVPFYAVWRNIYFLTIMLSLLCTLGVFVLGLKALKLQTREAVCVFVLPLMLSTSFVVFSTSGFENPLLHVLFAGFAFLLWQPIRAYGWLWLSLLTSLSAVTRLDTVVFYAPIWAYLLWAHRREMRMSQVALGAMPLVMWEIFSLFYYGFLFPNTKYAKLNTGMSTGEYIVMGLHYLLNLLAVDMFSCLLLLATLVALPCLARRYVRGRDERAGLLFAIAGGVVCYTAYVVYVGGTYITGRMLTLQILAAVWVLAAVVQTMPAQPWLWRWAWVLCALKLLYPSAAAVEYMCRKACFNGVWWVQKGDEIALRDYVRGTRALPPPDVLPSRKNPAVGGSMGQWGWLSKREVKIIDSIGLADALIARLPIKGSYIYSMGNLPRTVPEGYLLATMGGDISEMDEDLGEYYLKLRLIISGDLMDWERVEEIWYFNRGEYDDLLASYIKRHPPLPRLPAKKR